MMGVSQQQHKMETGSTVKLCVLQMATLIGISRGAILGGAIFLWDTWISLQH